MYFQTATKKFGGNAKTVMNGKLKYKTETRVAVAHIAQDEKSSIRINIITIAISSLLPQLQIFVEVGSKLGFQY